MDVPAVKTSHEEPLRRFCGAQGRQRKAPCRKPAGWGTNHVGQGRCRLHGGNMPITHGRYSKISRPRIRELMDELAKDPAPLDTLPEVFFVRAALIDWTERYDQFTEALIAWHESFRIGDYGPGKPHQVLDVADGYRMASEVTRMVERIQKQQERRSVPFGLFAEFGRALLAKLRARLPEEHHDGIERDFRDEVAVLASKLDQRGGRGEES